MHPDVVSTVDDKVPLADVRLAQADGLDSYRAGRPPAIASVAGLDAKDIGQVADMKLPAGFVAGQKNDGGFGNSGSFQEFHSAGDADVKVFFQYRGHRMSQDASDKFHHLLSEPPHNLRQSEIDQLGEVLEGKSQPTDFQITTAKTQDIHGKRVLVVEGDYLNFGLRSRTLYVDSDGTGSAVQEIAFQAPKDLFNKNVVQGTKSLESINWK